MESWGIIATSVGASVVALITAYFQFKSKNKSTELTATDVITKNATELIEQYRSQNKEAELRHSAAIKRLTKRMDEMEAQLAVWSKLVKEYRAGIVILTGQLDDAGIPPAFRLDDKG